LEPLPKGDVLLHCGDFTKMGFLHEIEHFNTFLKQQDFKHKIVIAGNHDIAFDARNYAELLPKFHGR